MLEVKIYNVEDLRKVLRAGCTHFRWSDQVDSWNWALGRDNLKIYEEWFSSSSERSYHLICTTLNAHQFMEFSNGQD